MLDGEMTFHNRACHTLAASCLIPVVPQFRKQQGKLCTRKHLPGFVRQLEQFVSMAIAFAVFSSAVC